MDGSFPPNEMIAGPVAVGTDARRLFRHRLLARHGMARVNAVLHHWVLRPAMRVLVMIFYTARYGRAVRRHYGIPIRRQIAEQLRLIFADGINPKIYYFLELYRMWTADIGGQCLMRYEIKNGLLRALHKARPRTHGRRTSLGHKLAYGDMCNRYGLPTPEILVAAAAGSFTWRVATRDALNRDLFLKPEISRGSRGALWLQHIGNDRYLSGDGREMDLDAVLDLVAHRSKAKVQLLQARLVNHRSLADLATDSLIVFRIFTCMDRFGQPVATHAMLRTISKLEPSWHRIDEYAAPVDLVTGELGLMCGDKQFGPTDWYETHPVTGAQVKGRIVQYWSDIRDLAVAGHRVFDDRMLLGWDVALTPDGPVLVEANAYPDTEFLQRVHRRPIGQSRLGEVLDYQIGQLSPAGDRPMPGPMPTAHLPGRA